VDSDKLTALDMGPRRYPVFLAWEPSEHRQIAVQTERLRGVTEASRGSTGLGGGDGGDGKGEGKEGEEDVGSGFKPPAGASGSDTNEEPDTEVATLFCTNNEVRPAVILRCWCGGCSGSVGSVWLVAPRLQLASLALGLHAFAV
jgi:hypothetical protein